MKKAYYFSHDSNASQDPKIQQMLSVYKAEGYGWYWILIEAMRNEEGYKLSLRGKYVWNAFAIRTYTNPDTIKQFVHDCINEFHLFDSDGDFFWSNSLLRRMEKMAEKSEKARQSVQARWKKVKTKPEKSENIRDEYERNTNVSKNDTIKEKKVNESKRNEIKVNENKYYDKHDKNDKLNIFTKLLIDNKIINKEDLKIYEYDLFLDSLFKEHSKNELLIVINYVIKRMKENGEIENKLGYFITAVKDGLKQINRPGFDYDEWEQSMKEIAVRMNEEGRF